jgi:hypothetical protein
MRIVALTIKTVCRIIAAMLGYDDYLERIQAEAVSGGLDEIRLAREEFHKLTGEFDEGEPWYDLRMHMFLDWYLLDRVGPQGLTPTERYLVDNRARLSPEEITQLINLTVTLRSVFRIASIRGEELLLHDLTGGGHWLTVWTLPMVGLKVSDIIDSRIVLFGDRATTGRGAVLHPREAHEAIERIIERARSEGMAPRVLVDHLDKMRLKLDRYSNVRIRHVYQYPGDALL